MSATTINPIGQGTTRLQGQPGQNPLAQWFQQFTGNQGQGQTQGQNQMPGDQVQQSQDLQDEQQQPVDPRQAAIDQLKQKIMQDETQLLSDMISGDQNAEQQDQQQLQQDQAALAQLTGQGGSPASDSGSGAGDAGSGGGGGMPSSGGGGGVPSGGGGSSSGGGGGTPDAGSGGGTSSAGDTGQTSGGPPSAQPTGNVKSWIDQAKQVLAQNGTDVSKISDADLNLIIQKESGGDPHAQNNTDSNAAAGHPSKGLMQTIDSTFNDNAAPGHHDIWNPVDNIVAGVNYANKRYGSISNVPGVKAVHAGGSYVGY